MKRKWFKRILLTVGVLVLLSPCVYCYWIAWGQNILFQRTLPVFPGAQQVSSAYGWYCCGKGLQVLYYWTSSSAGEVQRYYETFTLPFVISIDGLRTAFNPRGDQLPIVTNEFSREIINPAQNRDCYYRLTYSCVVLRLMSFGQSDQVTLPPLPVMRISNTPSPLSPELKGGTLIVYDYFVEDIS